MHLIFQKDKKNWKLKNKKKKKKNLYQILQLHQQAI